jgi:hypothetical protein
VLVRRNLPVRGALRLRELDHRGLDPDHVEWLLGQLRGRRSGRRQGGEDGNEDSAPHAEMIGRAALLL